jgi:hypothetical protein
MHTEGRARRARAEDAIGGGDDDDGDSGNGGDGVLEYSGRVYRVPRRSSRHVCRCVAAGRGRR